MTGAPWWSAADDGIVLQVRATPGAKRSEVVGPHGDRLRVRVAAPAVDGKANKELKRVLAAWCGVRPSAVTIQRGETSRQKTVHITGPAAPPA